MSRHAFGRYSKLAVYRLDEAARINSTQSREPLLTAGARHTNSKCGNEAIAAFAKSRALYRYCFDLGSFIIGIMLVVFSRWLCTTRVVDMDIIIVHIWYSRVHKELLINVAPYLASRSKKKWCQQ